jgi:hypothetical protein
MVTSRPGNGTANGTIKDAVTANVLPGVALVARDGWNNNTEGEVLGTYTTDASGRYSVALPYGNYTLTATLSGYITGSINIVVTQTQSVKNATLNPIMNEGVFRIVLEWGATPRDLDSHLRAANNVHVYYSRKTSTYAWLDVDDTSSYGPETITIENLAALGGFNYMIHNYSNSGASPSSAAAGILAASGATVKVYYAGLEEPIRTYYVPRENGTVWNVFSMSAEGVITDLNTFAYQSASQVGEGLPLPGVNALSPSAQGSDTDVLAPPLGIDELKDYEVQEFERRLSLYGDLLQEARATIDSGLYSPESAAGLAQALTNAQTLLYDFSATEEALTEASEALRAAIAAAAAADAPEAAESTLQDAA